MSKKKAIPEKYQSWIDARKRHHLSDAHVQMARALGLNPKKLRGMDNHQQEPWKKPLPEYIEALYFKSFGKERPDEIRSIEQLLQIRQKKKARRQSVKSRKTLLPPGTE